MNPTRNKLLFALLLVLAMIATACGGSEDSTDGNVIVVEGASGASDQATTDDSTATTDSDGDSASNQTNSADTDAQRSDEDQALEFAACMRDEGIDFPDPEVNADGSVDFFTGAGRRNGDGGGFRADPNFRGAIGICGELIERANFLPNAGDSAEREDTFLAVAECLRDNGIDVADPDFGGGGGGPGAGGLFGADFDPDDPATADAIEACRDLFAGLGRGGN